MASEMPPKKLNMGSKLVRVMFRPTGRYCEGLAVRLKRVQGGREEEIIVHLFK